MILMKDLNFFLLYWVLVLWFYISGKKKKKIIDSFVELRKFVFLYKVSR